MLEAQDIGAVLSWSERQLGDAAKRAAVIEVNDEVAPEWVERSGTGVNQTGCEAFISVMADSIQRVANPEKTNLNYQESVLVHNLRTRASSVH